MSDKVLISWTGRYGSGTDVPCTPAVDDAIRQIATHMAAMHGELLYEASTPPKKRNIRGMGAAYGVHLHQTDPVLWERFKGEAIALIRCLQGSAEHVHTSVDSQAYFGELHDFAKWLRRD